MLGDEGVVLRRLFNVFSFRPVIVQTIPIIGNFVNNPYNIPVMNNIITTIPYITYRVPTVSNTAIENEEYDLGKSNSFIQFYLENNTFVPKTTYILHLYGPLIFYVPRRSVNIPIVLPPSVRSLPMTKLSNLKTVTTVINVPDNIVIDSGDIKTISLRSAVTIDFNIIEKNNGRTTNEQIISGHNTYLFKNTIESQMLNDICCYAPHRVIENNNVALFSVENADVCKDRIKTLGTIIIYDKPLLE
jgi:hypothetical protein